MDKTFISSRASYCLRPRIHHLRYLYDQGKWKVSGYRVCRYWIKIAFALSRFMDEFDDVKTNSMDQEFCFRNYKSVS